VFDEPAGIYRLHRTEVKFSEHELLSLLQSDAGKFSPNVLLRPLYQSVVLPDVMFVGGPSEIGYWMALKELFAEHGIFFPWLQLRHHAMILNSSQSAKCNRLDLSVADLFDDTGRLIRKALEARGMSKTDISTEKSAMEKLLNSLLEKLVAVEPTLAGAAGAERQKLMQSVERLEEKLMRAAKRKNDETVSAIKNLKAQLFPHEALQERSENFLSFYCRSGKSFSADLLYAIRETNAGNLCVLTES
jgi:uncharacterized protein YllA (UPF0747 family)